MDDGSSGRTQADSVSATNASISSGASSSQSDNTNDGTIRVFNYKNNDFKHFSSSMVCEEIRTAMCRLLGIAPPAQLLFGIREHWTSRRPSPLVRHDLTWVMPGERLHCQLDYCFRMRFRVPELDSQLEVIDVGSHDFLYAQMRYDMRNELISEMKYPAYKNKTMGLAFMDILIDKHKQSPAEQQERSIERNYQMYLPSTVWQKHWLFASRKIDKKLFKMGDNFPSVECLKWRYVHRVSHLAPTYMTEQFTVIVQCLPNADLPLGGKQGKRSTNSSSGIDVYVRLFPHDSAEPGLKVARVKSKATLKWILLGRVEDIFMISKIDCTDVLLEFVNLPRGYQMKFHNEKEMKSFISYLGIYNRMSSKWMQDLCPSYRTPSLAELDSLYCHGPIGGAYSLMKLHRNQDKCGSYIIRECDREYDVYYIDIITNIIANRCKTETFCIVRKDSQWKLNINKNEHTFNTLQEVARFIPADVTDRIRIPASVNDNPPLLLLLLPKNLKPKRTDIQLSEEQLQRLDPQVFVPKTDLQWYPGSVSLGEDDMMLRMRGDWIQQSPVKDVSVAIKMMKKEGNFMEFIRLTQAWTLIQSPQFLKLYGLTVSDPYTMVMEYSSHGPLNRFLRTTHVGNKSLVELMKGLVRGMLYLEDNKIIHTYIRCSNLYVTKYDPVSQMLDAKIGDPGYPRDYRQSDLPWIPTKYYQNLQEAKMDINTQRWAFATTIYEIFSRCRKDLRKLTQEDLERQILNDGHILPLLITDLCPPQISETIMDGWSDDRKISHQDIFSRLIDIKTDDHMPPPLDMNGIDDAEDGGNIIDLAAYNIIPSADMGMVVELKDCRLLFCERDKIGEGNFGVVYRGHLEYYDKLPGRELVAVKKLKGSQVSASDFRREMQIMSALDHPNIVKFKCWSESITSIVMEFLFGSFKKYLSFMAPRLNNANLVCYALDIAHGMKYLSDIGLIHRDLSARNILVDRSGGKDCLKISDFGLAQFANAEGVANCPNYEELPFMWYSPEAMITHKCSSYSDVWSYGVTLVETFSMGADPNLVPMQTSPEDFLNRLRQGERFPRPDCPDFIYDLMLMCWNATPKSRPSFATIVEFISREMGAVDGMSFHLRINDG